MLHAPVSIRFLDRPLGRHLRVTTMDNKTRLDAAIVARNLAPSREQARSWIMAGAVFVDGTPATKPGALVAADADIQVRRSPAYVSRGGTKLEAALDAFTIDPTGWIVADVGASTGGFTDCLLQRGAARVVAIDVGYGQLAWSLRQDPRVTLLERTNARYLDALPDDQRVDLVTVDVSFISLRLILPAIVRWLRPTGAVIALIKPQFEAGREQVGKGGVVRDPAIHRQVLETLLDWMAAEGWAVKGLIRSPITGPKGNVEFLCWLSRAREEAVPDRQALIRQCVPS